MSFAQRKGLRRRPLRFVQMLCVSFKRDDANLPIGYSRIDLSPMQLSGLGLGQLRGGPESFN